MLDAYERHPDAFTSSAAERAALPPAWWEKRLAPGDNAADVVLGAFIDATLAGVVGLSFETRTKARHKATLFGMYVPPSSRHAGLGRTLVDAALAHAAARPGIAIVQLTVTAGNTSAQTLYERCGFIPFGTEPYAVALGGGFVSKVHMWRRVGTDANVRGTKAQTAPGSRRSSHASPDETVSVRRAAASDFAAMWPIFEAVIAGGDTYVFAPDSTREDAHEYWFGRGVTSFVAERGGSIVGMYKLIANQRDLGAHVANASFMVDPAIRGAGIGKTMGGHCLREAKARGYAAIQFNFVVSTNEGAVALWQSLGFAIVGTLPRAFRHLRLGFVDVHVMYRGLDDIAG